ncbi:MAG: hypothetical protein KGN76_01160 [Acidobacteriota bacterium]|nr:hypothetical protein [Acidobacteriota bacterium]
MPRHTVALCVSLLLAASMASGATLKATWLHRQVALKQPLYSVLVMRSTFGGGAVLSRQGLAVVSPEKGVYYQFHGSFFSGDRDVTGSNIDDVFDEISAEHRLMPPRMAEPGSGPPRPPMAVSRPARLVTYTTGTLLQVRKVAIGKDRVTLTFDDLHGEHAATTLTVQWPQPFSPGLTEQPEIEQLLEQFLALTR